MKDTHPELWDRVLEGVVNVMAASYLDVEVHILCRYAMFWWTWAQMVGLHISQMYKHFTVTAVGK